MQLGDIAGLKCFREEVTFNPEPEGRGARQGGGPREAPREP